MGNERRYVMIEYSLEQEKEMNEWFKEKEIHLVPETHKGIDILDNNKDYMKENVNQKTIEQFIQTLLIPMKIKLEEELKVKVFFDEKDANEYLIVKIVLENKEIEKKIIDFFGVEKIVTLFKEQERYLYGDIYPETFDEDYFITDFDEDEDNYGVVQEVFEVKPFELNPIFKGEAVLNKYDPQILKNDLEIIAKEVFGNTKDGINKFELQYQINSNSILFIVESIKIKMNMSMDQIQPEDYVEELYILCNFETKTLEAFSNDRYYQDYAEKLKMKIESYFKTEELKNIFKK